MYSGYERSPRKRFAFLVTPLAEPQAPNKTSTGKMKAMHTNSYRQLKLIPFPDGIYGTAKSAINISEQIQNAPFTFLGLNVRASSIPILNGNNILINPPQKFTVSMVQPTPIISYCDMSPMKNNECAIPSSNVKNASTLVDIRRRSRA